MDKFLITGFSGFVSKHFLEYLESLEVPVSILGIDLHQPAFDFTHYHYVQCSFERTDLLDKGRVDDILYQFQPDYILHLASFSSVAFSWKNPSASFANNTNIFLNVLEQIRALNLHCRILSIGSSEEYGDVREAEMPLREDHSLKPVSPYAVARVSQEMLSRVYVDGFGMDIIITRSFNHIGPGQKEIFVISSFARQLVEIKKYNKAAELVTGDLSIIRDFTDVRDVVRAYYTLLKNGRSGEIYNVCSGRGTRLDSIVQQMAGLLKLEVITRTDPSLVRPKDNSIIIGSNEKIKKQTGWETRFSLEESLQDMINYWQANS